MNTTRIRGRLGKHPRPEIILSGSLSTARFRIAEFVRATTSKASAEVKVNLISGDGEVNRAQHTEVKTAPPTRVDRQHDHYGNVPKATAITQR